MAVMRETIIGEIKTAQTGGLQLRLIEQEVCEYWAVIFSLKGIESLTKQDMTGFLSFKQNRRWRDISKEDVTLDMPRLRQALLILVDENRPIEDRLQALEPGRGNYAIPYLGKAKLSPILMMSNPKKYGVWNDHSERALAAMSLMPTSKNLDLGSRYAAFNAVLLRLAGTYGVSLWRLDGILEIISRKSGKLLSQND